jgi:hypothetical protein
VPATQYLKETPLAGFPPAKGALQFVQQMQQLRPWMSTIVHVCPRSDLSGFTAKAA